MKHSSLIPAERIEKAIYLIRGQRVMLDRDLAKLYGVPTKAFNQAVKRHAERFPPDFMFQLTSEEARAWWLEINANRLRSQIVTLKRGQHIKYRPYVFTEHGILMLSSALNSDRAIQVNIEIMRSLFLLTQFPRASAEIAPVLRDRALEIVDAKGRVRASISVREPVTPLPNRAQSWRLVFSRASEPFMQSSR